MTVQLVTPNHNVETVRAASAERIRALMKQWTANALALSAELAQARESFPLHPKRPNVRMGWEQWARAQTGLSKSQISKLLQIHYKFHHRADEKGQLAGNVLAILAANSVPESARIEAMSRAAKGEHVTDRKAKKIVAQHKLPKPKAANQQAAEEGHPVLASDGYIYFGTDQSKRVEGADRRRMVYGVRDALKHLGSIKLTGREFLEYAFPHQLWTPEDAPIIKAALRWLADLDKAWDSKT